MYECKKRKISECKTAIFKLIHWFKCKYKCKYVQTKMHKSINAIKYINAQTMGK